MNRIALWTIVRKEVSRVVRIWSQTVIPPILTSSLFVLIFGYSLGSRISEVAGVTYLEFILPGLLMMGVINSAYSSTSFPLFISKFHGSIQELLVAPVSYWEIIVGYSIAALLRSVIVGVGILGVSLFFTSIQVHSWLILISFAVISSLLFAFAGIVSALWADSFDKMNLFLTFVITPLTYLGGVFYSITMLPEFWAKLALFNPILYMVDGFRYGFIGVSDVSVWISFIVVSMLAAMFFGVCVWMFRAGYKLRT